MAEHKKVTIRPGENELFSNVCICFYDDTIKYKLGSYCQLNKLIKLIICLEFSWVKQTIMSGIWAVKYYNHMPKKLSHLLLENMYDEGKGMIQEEI
uniref:Uncharacterized protein n=1 Tax=Nelumbo nucifera TaxID=4432 RepID=A0A822Z6B2_NELNU|nr:TPA_asm: hypothetical protein HUJ06_013534 [Nelumbo nucifera]